QRPLAIKRIGRYELPALRRRVVRTRGDEEKSADGHDRRTHGKPPEPYPRHNLSNTLAWPYCASVKGFGSFQSSHLFLGSHTVTEPRSLGESGRQVISVRLLLRIVVLFYFVRRGPNARRPTRRRETLRHLPTFSSMFGPSRLGLIRR